MCNWDGTTLLSGGCTTLLDPLNKALQQKLIPLTRYDKETVLVKTKVKQFDKSLKWSHWAMENSLQNKQQEPKGKIQDGEQQGFMLH